MGGSNFIYWPPVKGKKNGSDFQTTDFTSIFFLQANIAHFQILYKYFLKGILHIEKKDEKTSFLEQNESKNEQNL